MMRVAISLWPKLAALALVVGLGGCQTATLPDPNEPADTQAMSGEVLLRNINELRKTVEERLAQGDITPPEAERLFQDRVQAMLAAVDLQKVPEREFWKYGDAFRQGDDWEKAREFYERAVKVAETDDRRINDTLRLARAEAHLGNVDRAIELSRSTFDAPPQEKAPILMAVLYEVVPSGEGKDKDAQLARLLRDAIGQHMATTVDPDSAPGKAFLLARPRHVENAWGTVARLFAKAGDQEAARQAVLDGQRMLRSFGQM